MYAVVEILMDDAYMNVVFGIGVGSGIDEKVDEKIFFYVDSMEDLESLKNEDNGEDFVVTNIKEVFEDSSFLF